MIAVDFAANESWDDATAALKIMLQPWKWKKGNSLPLIDTYFKRKFPEFFAYYFLSGRAALFHLLSSLNLPKNSEVVVQAFTCEAVILPIIAAGLKPIYCDIEISSFSMNPIAFQKKITDRTKVVILQHSFGLKPVHRAEVLSIIRKHNLLLIEDIAHGYNQSIISEDSKAPYNKHCYLMSFGRSKAYSSVAGGAVLIHDKTVLSSMNQVRASLQSPSLFLVFRLLLYKPLSVIIKATYDIYIGKCIHYVMNYLGLLIPEVTKKEKQGNYDSLFDKAYPNALAYLLFIQLAKYEQVQISKAQICSIYLDKISNSQFPISDQIMKLKKSNVYFSLLRFPLRVNNPEELRKKAAKQNIFLGRWYDQAVAPKSLDLTKVGYKIGSCPMAEKLCREIINLPLNIDESEALKVISIMP